MSVVLNIMSSSRRIICEQLQKCLVVLELQHFCSSERGSFFVNVFNTSAWNIAESPIEYIRVRSSIFLKFTVASIENIDEKRPWLRTTKRLYLFTYILSTEGWEDDDDFLYKVPNVCSCFHIFCQGSHGH